MTDQPADPFSTEAARLRRQTAAQARAAPQPRPSPNHFLPDVRIFSLMSWGCAATAWLARALNSHPYILCAHNMRAGLIDVGGPRIGAWDYLRMFAYSERGYRAIGDVHGVYPNEIEPFQATLGDRFRCAVLKREPLAWLRSMLALLRGVAFQGDWGELGDAAIAESIGLDPKTLTVEQRFTLHCAYMLNWIVHENASGMRIFRMEDVTSDPTAFADLVTELTGGAVECDPTWVAAVLAMPHINQHASSTSDDLDNWTMDIVGRVVRKEAWDLYRALGYPAVSAVS